MYRTDKVFMDNTTENAVINASVDMSERFTVTKQRPFALMLAASALGLMVSADSVADDAAERLSERLEPLETYHASFEQKILDGSGERLQEAHGEMWLARPGLLRWEVAAPYAQTVVSDGEDVYLYDPDLEQVTVQAVDERVTHTPALLLSGDIGDLTASYDVYHENSGEEVFTLVPSTADTLFEELNLMFEGDRLTELWMTDSTGQRTAIMFSAIRQNADIPDERFTFTIPDGVDVIREGP